MTLHLFLMILAPVLFILAALPVGSSIWNRLVAGGLASLTLAWLLGT